MGRDPELVHRADLLGSHLLWAFVYIFREKKTFALQETIIFDGPVSNPVAQSVSCPNRQCSLSLCVTVRKPGLCVPDQTHVRVVNTQRIMSVNTAANHNFVSCR